MSDKRYTEEFKIAAVRQISEQGYPVLEVSERLGITAPYMHGYGSINSPTRVINKRMIKMRRSNDFRQN